MHGHTSHFAGGRDGRPRRRRVLQSLIGAVFLLSVLGIGLLAFPHTELGRTLDAHLTTLADPRSWLR